MLGLQVANISGGGRMLLHSEQMVVTRAFVPVGQARSSSWVA